jgi:hypothetical protein
MAKVKLGARPKTFNFDVTFKMLDGTEGIIPVAFKYRTRTEFGAFIDAMNADLRAVEPPQADVTNGKPVGDASPAAVTMKGFWQEMAAKNGKYIMQVVDSWGLDEPFTLENVQQLADEVPAGAIAIMNTYRLAIQEGQLGN